VAVMAREVERIPRSLTVAALLALVVTTAALANDGIACGAAAETEYHFQKAAVFEKFIGRAAEGKVAIRRLEEAFCTKMAQCLSRADKDPAPFDKVFTQCLDDEAKDDLSDD
jgi:hypothetical protein